MKSDLTRKVYRHLNGTGNSGEMRKLSLEDTLAQKQRGLKVPHSRNGSGYNPYETFPNTSSPEGITRHKDLRQLSRWIRLKREVEAVKDDDSSEKK